MKPVTWLALALIALGLIGFLFGGITWTETEEVAKVFGTEIKAQKERGFPISQTASAILLVGGVIVLVMGMRKG